jgi:hypothetical protein
LAVRPVQQQFQGRCSRPVKAGSRQSCCRRRRWSGLRTRRRRWKHSRAAGVVGGSDSPMRRPDNR